MSKAATSPRTGQLLVALCWHATQLTELLKPLTTVIYKDDLGVADFLPSKDTAVIFISEADILSGGGFRRRVVKFRQHKCGVSGGTERRAVIVQNTALTAQHFANLQKFISIDLGLTVIPVQSMEDTAQLLARMVTSETKIQSNPLRLKPRTTHNPDLQLLRSLTSTVPGMGEHRARSLLIRFGTLSALAMAPREDLEAVVGKSAGAALHEFFCGMA